MSRLTIFLARLIGLFAVLITVSLFARGTGIVTAAVGDAPVMFAYATISLGIGLAMVLGHNVWRGGALPVVVTVVGWLIFAKGMMLMLLRPDALMGFMQGMHYEDHAYAYLAPAFVIGLYLTWAGFTAKQSLRVR